MFTTKQVLDPLEAHTEAHTEAGYLNSTCTLLYIGIGKQAIVNICKRIYNNFKYGKIKGEMFVGSKISRIFAA